MSQSIQGLASAGLISNPFGAGGAPPSPNEFNDAVGSATLSVDGNAVDTGRYLVIASTASTHGSSSYANDGQITVYDKQTNTYMNVWGDPHLTASDGTSAEFQKNGLAIKLADGTIIEIQPTVLSNGVAHISEVAVTNGNGTVLMSNFEGQAGSQVNVGAVQAGDAKSADPSMGNINDTVINVGTQDIGALTTYGGSQIVSSGPAFSLDGLGGGVSQFFTNFVTPQMIGAGEGSTGTVVGNSDQSTQPFTAPTATGVAVARVTTPTSSLVGPLPDVGALMQSLTAQINASLTLTPSEKIQALTSLNMTQAELLDAPAPTPAATVVPAPSSDASAGIGYFTIENILREADGLAPLPAAPVATPTAPAAPAVVSTTVPGAIQQLVQTINASSLNASVKAVLTDSAQNLLALMAALPPQPAAVANTGPQTPAAVPGLVETTPVAPVATNIQATGVPA